MNLLSEITNLSILTSMITPAVLILASSQMIVATSQRLGRVMERIRELNDQLLTLRSKPEKKEEVRNHLIDLMDLTLKRAVVLQKTMMSLYLALSTFIMVSFSIGIINLGKFENEWFPVLLGVAGVLLLLLASFLLLYESRISFMAINAEARLIENLNGDIRKTRQRRIFPRPKRKRIPPHQEDIRQH